MEAVVDQALGDVVDRDPVIGEAARVDDALVRHPALVAPVQDRVGLREPGRQVVGVQDRDAGRLRDACPAHQPEVGPRDQQDRRRPERRCRDGALVAGARVARQVFRQVRLDADRAHARAAAAVRDREGLVQVQVADVAAQVARSHQAHHGVHVGAVDVDLAAVLVRDVADLAHRLLEDAVRRRVGDHHGREPVARLGGLRREVGHVDVAVVGRLHRHHLQARHRRRCRVGAVRRGGDQADVALVAARVVVGADRHQPGVLALRARVGLHRERVVAGDLAELVLEVVDHLEVTLGLARRGVGMDRGELRPGDGGHLGSRVELHGARSERDHRPVQRQVAVAEATHVAHHLRLGPVHVEHGMRQVFAFPEQVVRDGGCFRERLGRVDAERVEHPGEHLERRGLVAGDADLVAADLAKVDAPLLCRGEDARLADPDRDGDGVEEVIGLDVRAAGPQRLRERDRHQVHPLRDRPQPRGAVEDGVEGGHHREQGLRRAHV